MLKRVAVSAALVALVAASAYWFGGFRIAVDGSGTWPRFVSRPQYAALEADRSRHRQASVAVATESREPAITLVQAPVADEPRAAAPAAASLPPPD